MDEQKRIDAECEAERARLLLKVGPRFRIGAPVKVRVSQIVLGVRLEADLLGWVRGIKVRHKKDSSGMAEYVEGFEYEVSPSKGLFDYRTGWYERSFSEQVMSPASPEDLLVPAQPGCGN